MELRKEAINYQNKFDPQTFLKQRFREPGTPINQFRDMRLQIIHKLFSSISDNIKETSEFKVLDYGSGPVIAFVISAAGKDYVSEIVLAEYTLSNREALQNWIEKDSLAFDWQSYIKYVVQDLEKKPVSEVDLRKKQLRSLLTVVSCDITANHPIEKGFEGPYNVVLTSLAIGSACHSEAEFINSIEKVSELVKPGGILYMFSKLAQKSQPMYYELGGENFYYYAVTKEVVLLSLKQSGFVDIQLTSIPIAATISGLSKSDAGQLEIHLSSEEFYYASLIAKKQVV